MPRHARIMLAGTAVHLIQRGNNRAPCFFSDEDRKFYLFHLARLLPRARCALHAYCLMTNHVHLLATPQEIVQRERYVLTCYRYIELNPVRAQLVESAAQYEWSSFGSNAGKRARDELTPHPEYLALGATSEERRAVYRDLFGADAAGEFDEIRQATTAGYVAGDERFKQSIARAVGRRVEQGEPGRPRASVTDDNPSLFDR